MTKEEIQKTAEQLYPTVYYLMMSNIQQLCKQEGFIKGAEWADKTMLDKACEWIIHHYDEYAHNNLGKQYLQQDFRKAMES